MNTQVLQGLLVPFLGTTLGAALVFFLKRDLPEKVQKGLSGFAAGVMVAASIWSLLIPALEGAADLGAWSFLPATIGFWLGILFLLLLDRLVPHVHLDGEQEGLRASLTRSMMVALAVALHNLPEGMAVGVVYAGSMQPEQVGSVSFASAFALAVGIALQNVPEGAIVAMPLRQAGMSRVKAFTLSAVPSMFGATAQPSYKSEHMPSFATSSGESSFISISSVTTPFSRSISPASSFERKIRSLIISTAFSICSSSTFA